MNEPLTPEQYSEMTRRLDNILNQYFDGYAVVGYHAQTHERIIFRNAVDPKTMDALNSMLHTAACIPALNLEPPPDGKVADHE